MASYSLTINSISPSVSYGTLPSCNIKGRLIPYVELLPRLKNYCLSLGFKKPIVMSPDEPSAALDTMYDDNPDLSLAMKNSTCAGNDSVIILSTRVPYEPSWGVYSGLPRPLIHERTNHRTEATIANFIAPYLAQYNLAQKHIYLACKEADKYIITLPSDLVNAGTESDVKKLKICLDKIAEPDENGHFTPLFVSESFVSFQLSEQFLHLLSDNHFSWKAGKVQRIGTFLTAELFDFEDDQQSTGSNGSKSTFVDTLLPVMNRIVTNTNPQLLAAIIQLQTEFSKAVSDVMRTNGNRVTGNLLCVAGLDIDVGAFRGRGKRYFVPWVAYWQQGGVVQHDDTNNQLEQDDLFVALMAQEKKCLVI